MSLLQTTEGSIKTTGDGIEFDVKFNLFNFKVDFTDTESSLASLERIDKLLTETGQEMSNVGALMNRLESVSASQIVQIENYTATMSTIMDADISEESANYVRNQILQRTTAALITQSSRFNSSLVMRLLG